MTAADLIRLVNPLAAAFDRMLDDAVRPRFFKKMNFSEPVGDPGWFGPGSAVWHVHSHMPTMFLGLVCAAHMEGLHPSIAWMGYDHSRLAARDDNGTPTGGIDPEGAKVRFAHSLAFFTATAYGPSDTAMRAARAVRAMHHTIKGTRPDGVSYDADDAQWLRWNYATVVWGIATAHERYHPNPLLGAEIDRYYGEFVRVGEALGGTDLPATKAEVAVYLLWSVPLLGLTAISSSQQWPNIKKALPPRDWPLQWFLGWAKNDMLPDWAQSMVLFDKPNPAVTMARRAALWTILNTVHAVTGPLREFRESQARVAGVTDLSVPTFTAPAGPDPKMTRQQVEAFV